MTADSIAPLQQLLAGQYLLERELGRGGMGIVYLGRELRLDRLVAIKVLPPHLGADPELRERFLREARTAAQLSHPNIVPIFRADEVGGFAFFTMAFIDGEGLGERLRTRGPLPPDEAVRILRETAWALAYAHARGVVHRDIKPENIMIERGSHRAIVTDFGIARDQLAASLTQDGMILGSVHYMSPEQAAGDKVDGRSDLYSLGVVGFQVLSGQLPFEAVEAAAVMAQQVTRPPPPLASVAPSIPRELAGVIDRCLSKAPADRYSDGEALAEALQAAVQTAPLPARAGSRNEIVGTDEARAIWLRAAQIQADATARLQARYRDQPASDPPGAPTPSGGYRMADVELAAAEAGIGAEYVAMAVAERGAISPVGGTELSQGEERLLARMMGTRDQSISRSRIINGSPKAVLESIGRCFTAPPYSLSLRDTVGGHPLDGGIMVFDVPRYQFRGPSTSHLTSPLIYRMTQLEIDQLNVVLKPVGTPPTSCEVTVYGDLRRGLRKNWMADKWITGVVGVGGGAAGTAIGLAALALGPLAAVTGAGAAVVAGGASLAWYRWLFRGALAKGGRELEGLIGSVERALRAAEVFGG